MRRVRVAGPVAEHVVATVVRDPSDDRALDRHRADRREHDLQRSVRHEARVREEPVVPDRDAVAGHEVEDDGEDDVAQRHGVAPQQRDRDAERDARRDHEQRGHGTRRRRCWRGWRPHLGCRRGTARPGSESGGHRVNLTGTAGRNHPCPTWSCTDRTRRRRDRDVVPMVPGFGPRPRPAGWAPAAAVCHASAREPAAPAPLGRDHRCRRLADRRAAPARHATRGLPPEGYELRIGADGAVTIAAADDAGEFYGRATLDQLRSLGDVPVGVDPRLARPPGARRDDRLLARQGADARRRCATLIDRLASWKVNHVQLYCEHTFAYRDHEDVWRDASPFTAEEIRDARRLLPGPPRRARPEPELPRPHGAAGSQHDRYRPLALAPPRAELPAATPPTTIDPTNPARSRSCASCSPSCSRTSPAAGCNVGLDEPWELPDERFDDYLTWLRTLRALPELEGREMLVWGDILAGRPERIARVPDGVDDLRVGLRGRAPVRRTRRRVRGRATSRSGSRPGTSSWCTIVGRVTNMRGALRRAPPHAALAHGGAGFLNTDWGDLGHLQYLPISDPGLAYGAAVVVVPRDEPRPRPRRRVERCTRTTTRPASSAAALARARRRPPGDHARRRRTSPRWSRTSTGPQLQLGPRVHSRGSTAAELDRVRGDPRRRRRPRRRDQRSERPDGDAPPATSCATARRWRRVLTRDARARLRGDGSLASVPSTPSRARRSPRASGPVIAEHHRLWLARNRPGGLDDSARVARAPPLLLRDRRAAPERLGRVDLVGVVEVDLTDLDRFARGSRTTCSCALRRDAPV